MSPKHLNGHRAMRTAESVEQLNSITSHWTHITDEENGFLYHVKLSKHNQKMFIRSEDHMRRKYTDSWLPSTRMTHHMTLMNQ